MEKFSLYALITCGWIIFWIRFLRPYLCKRLSWFRAPSRLITRLMPWVSVLIVVCMVEKRSPLTLGLSVQNLGKTWFVTVLASVFALLVIYGLAKFWKKLGYLRIEGDSLNFAGNTMPYSIITPSIIYKYLHTQFLYVALPEEITYRGFLLSRLMLSWNPVIAIFVSSGFFIFAHIDRPLMALQVFIFGLIYGMAFFYSGNIYPCFVAHTLSNLVGALILKHVAQH